MKCASAADGASFGSDGGGIVKDLDSSVATDFTDGLHPKALSATVYMIFASLAPCFAFGGLVLTLPGLASLQAFTFFSVLYVMPDFIHVLTGQHLFS